MLLRWIVTNYLRQNGEQTVRKVAGELLSSRKPRIARDSASPDEPSGCDVAVLFALPIESAGMVDRLTEVVSTRCESFVEHTGLVAGKQVVVAEMGLGQTAATQAAADIIRFHQPRWLISAGFAGGLRDDVRPGHLVLVDKVVRAGSEPLAIGLQCDAEWLAANRGVHAGKLITVDEIVRTAAEKRTLAEQYGAIACDMETFAVADVCRLQQTSLLAVRVITDAVDDTLPVEIDRLMRQKSLAGKLGAAASAILSRPTAAKDLWELRGVALKSSDRLAKFLESMIEQLPA